MRTFIKIFSIILLLILGGGGIYGGWMLISAPGGEKLQWTVDLLRNTPFQDFLIPGIILVIVNGILPVITVVLTLMRSRYYGWLILIQGCILIGWLTAEILFDRALFVPEMHILFYSIGLLLAVSGFLLAKK